MVGHDDKFINGCMGKMIRYCLPTFFGYMTCVIQHHFAIRDFPEQTFPVVGTYGDEIGAWAGIIITPQPDGTAVV